MNTTRINTSVPKDYTPPHLYTDYDWVRNHENELLEKFGAKFVVVYRENVIGVGETYSSAVENAESHLSPEVESITPLIYKLEEQPFFFRIYPSQVKSEE